MSILLKNFDVEFAIPPEDVGMKTGATIHTMNGLQMRATRVADDASPPKTDGWWEMQHLRRGLSATGRRYDTEEDAAWQTVERKAVIEDKYNRKDGECPMRP